jgi:hypothetical protein
MWDKSPAPKLLLKKYKSFGAGKADFAGSPRVFIRASPPLSQ